MLGIIGTIIDGKRDNHDQHQECRGELLAAIQVYKGHVVMTVLHLGLAGVDGAGKWTPRVSWDRLNLQYARRRKRMSCNRFLS
jgi:hypothetical protein